MDRRRSTRAEFHVACTLRRRKGSPIPCRTRDVGPGGMCVDAERPLSVDEVVDFELPLDGDRAVGRARVLRQHGIQTYALRFEQLDAEATRRLEQLSAAA